MLASVSDGEAGVVSAGEFSVVDSVWDSDGEAGVVSAGEFSVVESVWDSVGEAGVVSAGISGFERHSQTALAASMTAKESEHLPRTHSAITPGSVSMLWHKQS